MTNPLFLIFLFLLLILLSHETVSQSLQDQERSVLLKLKKHWGDLPYMSQWTQSNSTSHCSWPGITCQSNSVTELNLPNIDIVDPIPPFICDLKNVTLINLDYNYVPGEFPKSLYNCSKLTVLVLTNNYFVGKLPDDIDRLANLRTLSLGGNNFTGDFPPAIGKLKELRYLNLGANRFNGSLAPEIGELSNLGELDLSNIPLLIPSRLPLSYTKLKKLKKFWAFESNLIGEIPESIGDMEALEWLDISSNNLSGKIPDGLFLLKNLSIAFLYRNNLSGEIPQVVEAPNLTIIDLSDNNLIGKIPQGFGNLTMMTGLALYWNRLSGPIPQGIGSLPYLQDLNLWENNLSGELPRDLGKYSMLRNLQVNGNNLSGKLPEHLCSQGNLIGLVAHDNSLVGELPESLGNCSGLVMVRVENNRLSGTVPTGLWNGFNMTMLLLSNNAFTGSIPEKISQNLSRVELSNNRFSGYIPNSVSDWKSLVVFEASNNLLTGPIPRELTALSNMTTLLLDQNELMGHLPSDIQSWKSLNTLNLSRNQLSGPIPEKLGLLPALTDLDLSNNLLSGQIPSLLGLLRLNVLNLSSNDLVGTVPREFEGYAYADSFSNNPGLCATNGLLKLRPCDSRPRKKEKITTTYLVLIVTLSITALILAALFALFTIRCYWTKCGLGKTWKLTSFQNINFKESNILSGLTDKNLIGSGGSGKVYRVPVNRKAEVVAVKRILNSRRLEHKLEQEFLTEVKVLSSIRHANIVKLMCCVSSETTKLLVYEYLENRSLDRWLSAKHRQRPGPALGSRSVHHGVLDWPKRLRIAVGAARGLCYMHHDCVPPVIHRDIKSSNILLDSDFNAKIADFGLAKLLVRQGEAATVSTFAGSFGYMAPECAHTTRVNEKIDVYSFGVVLLELATGREANEGDEHSCLAEWAWRLVQEGKPIEEALDDEVKEPSCVEEMIWVFEVGVVCTGSLPSSRPTMKEVVRLLLQCHRRGAHGDKFSGPGYEPAPLLKNSRRERVLEDDDDDDEDEIIAINV